jgi:DNA primase small subunit
MAAGANLLLRFVQDKFLEYYQNNSSHLQPPTFMEHREFGFLLFKGRVMLRHKSFRSLDELKASLETTAPSDVYYSSAYYERPTAKMEEKGFLGADLIFDIDADHIPTPCGKVHDSWICSKCGFAGKGPSPEGCPVCGESKFDAKTWICDVCLESAKSETIKLLDMLTEDFGFADKEIKTYFSGNRGYHVHVESENAKFLDSLARKEIVDYVIGLGFKIKLHRVIDKGRVLVDHDARGWKRRVAGGIETFLEKASAAQIEATGLDRRGVDFLNKNKGKLLESLEKNSYLDVKGVGPGNWKKIVEWIAGQQSAKIDTVVTTDTHRLIRLAGSLHGKTGLMKAEASLSGFDEFDPLKEAVAFKDGHITVDVTEAPEFRIGDSTYGPFKNAAQVELPTAAALFLCCRGAAKVVED